MFYADLHVHSKYSRATSRECDLEHLALWAGRKGISLVATGDITHPAWLEEIRQKLVPAEPGLFRLRPDVEAEVARQPGAAATSGVRFILEVEISTIYKKDGRTRKVHHLIYVPELEAAGRLVESLGRIGNLASDGRPILGLDSRNLLEIALESGPGAFLIPAHIWTPWFAVLGSMSGFDSIDHCYADLAGEIFALETGLSSDPPMNWRLSQLDRYRLVSNSDAHSPAKLGREACVFHTPMDYFALRAALQTGDGYGGTLEFFPEEGKYHLDGHRKCDVCFWPEETLRHNGKCPGCGKPLTLGVMHRVCALADRPEQPERPAGAAGFRSLIPLAEVLSEICGTGPDTKTVRQKYDQLLARLGPELFILDQAPLEDVAQHSSLLAEALGRMRAGEVQRQAGYDGEYGVIRLFTPDELTTHTRAGLLFEKSSAPLARAAGEGLGVRASGFSSAAREQPGVKASGTSPRPSDAIGLSSLDPDQRAAAESVAGPVLIIAGPGTGKTRVLTHRLAHLVADCGVAPDECLALTFSRRAAAEMRERLELLLPGQAGRVPVMTFHALALCMLREHAARLGLSPEVRVATEAERCELAATLFGLKPAAAERMLERISRLKRASAPAEESDAAALAAYEREMKIRNWLDFDDLVAGALRLLATCPDLVEAYRGRFRHVSVDEYQDIDPAQYELLRRLVPPDGNLFAIGDPDQAIYGFRGADVSCFGRFATDFPGGRTIVLGRNYRSSQTIVDAALELVAPASLAPERRLEALPCGPEQVEIHACSTERAEAELVVHTIDEMLGGSTFFSLDSRRAAGHEAAGFSFADFAVLYRTQAQAEPFVEAFQRSGMPFQHRSHRPRADQPFDVAESDVDLWDPRADRVSLLTLHASKGLEFGVVFIVGCEDGILPLRFGPADETDLAEERRLLFVGMTRARERLILTHARRRLWRGKVRPAEPSPMLEAVRRDLLACHQHRAVRKPAALDRQQTLF